MISIIQLRLEIRASAGTAIGTLETFWNMVDLGPGKRPDVQPQLDYDIKHTESCCH